MADKPSTATMIARKRSIKTRKTREGRPSLGIKLTDDAFISRAVLALRNNAVISTVEFKGPSSMMEVKTTFPSELVALARGMFPSNKTYRFEIHASGNLATIGGGVFNTAVFWSPAITSFAEWTALAALFDEVVLEKSAIEVTSAFGPTSTAIIFQVALAPDPASAAGSTPSYTTVQRLAESVMLHPYNLHVGNTGSYKRVHRLSADRPYASTAVPGGATGTPSGCLGQWDIASNIVGTPSINYLFHSLVNTVRLRNRA